MAENIEDITISYTDNGIETVRELNKHILSKGAWTTILFCYQDWDNQKQAYGPQKYSIRRYQKKNNQYWMKSKFNISSVDQAKKIIDVLSTWIENKENV
jgi:hypothetical protein